MASNNAIQRIGEIQKELEFDVADIKKVESGKSYILSIALSFNVLIEFTKVATAKQ